MDERKRRVGLNEALFRALNERLEEANETFAAEHRTDLFTMVCECGDRDCVDRFDVTRTAYEELRAAPARFAVLPGHDDPSVETVVAERSGYNVIEKHRGGPAELAEALAPPR